MLYRTWPVVPEPFKSVPYRYNKYREGYRQAYAGEPARVFQDPRTTGATAYLIGFNAGNADRNAGVQHSLDEDEREHVPVPDKFTSGHAYKAYRAGYKIAREVTEQQTPLERVNELFSRNRAIFVDNATWNSGTAFDQGWRAGTLAVGMLAFPTGPSANLPPPSL